MADNDRMTLQERDKYLRKMQKRYRKVDKLTKGELLDEMETVTELHRKSLTRLMGSNIHRKPRVGRRGPTYGPQVEYALRVISESLDHICAERLQPNLIWMAHHLSEHGELEISSPLLDKLEKISVSTVRRLLKKAPRDRPRLPRKGPERANRLAREIPARRIPWQEQEPGHFETDLVHCIGIWTIRIYPPDDRRCYRLERASRHAGTKLFGHKGRFPALPGPITLLCAGSSSR